MSKRPAKPEPVEPPSTVTARNPGSGVVTLCGPSGMVTIRPGQTEQVPGWVASHPGVVGERPLIVVEG